VNTHKANRVLRAAWLSISFSLLAIVLVAGAFWYQDMRSIPAVERQAEEVAALETHVLPVVTDLKATWYLNERFGTRSISCKHGRLNTDSPRGEDLVDQQTAAAFEQLWQAIRTSGVPTNRLREATFAEDGSLRSAAFKRRGGSIDFVCTYIYSPGAKPEEWTSRLGPVVLTRIGDSDWWFEQAPDD
jgi:hypothetical protein